MQVKGVVGTTVIKILSEVGDDALFAAVFETQDRSRMDGVKMFVAIPLEGRPPANRTLFRETRNSFGHGGAGFSSGRGSRGRRVRL
jgi:hypothetical protein